MKRIAQSEAAAAVMWMIGSLVLAAAMAPWLFQLGKWFAETAAREDLPSALEALGVSCRRAELGRYFSRSLIVSALATLPLLIWRIRILGGNDKGVMSLRKTSWNLAAAQLLMGCLIAGCLVWCLVLVLENQGAFVRDSKDPSFRQLMGKVLLPTLAAPLIEEWLFRGLLLGLWLRSARPLSACLGTSLIFAFLHFLSPPEGFQIANPQAPGAGFELLAVILFHFTELQFFITDFATLFVVGMILAWTRVATGSLWMAIGLHAGWVFTFKCATIYYDAAANHWLRPWGVGENVRSGLLPMLSLVITAGLCHLAMRWLRVSRLSTHDGEHKNPLKSTFL